MKKNNKIVIEIKGMHCSSCEMLIEEELKKIPEVVKVKVDYNKSRAEIYYDNQKPNLDEISEVIRRAGYERGKDESWSWLSRDPQNYYDLGVAVLWLVICYILLKIFGLTNFNISSPSSSSELGVIVLIGLTAGFSTCLALVGSVVLGIAARQAEAYPEASTWEKFGPHLWFNLGRVVTFFILGGILGVVGSIFQLSSVMQGILTVLVSLVMLVTGLKLLGIFPWLDKYGFTLPKNIALWVGIGQNNKKEYSYGSAFLVGGMTFFLPCGFTQAMQLLAISSGSFWSGALVMSSFALGTTAGLLAVGGVTSIVKGIFARRFFKFAGLVVIILSFFNISNGLNLTDWKTVFGRERVNVEANDPNVTIENGVQVIRMEENYNGYSPNKFVIRQGLQVRWLIDAKAANSCAASILVPSMNISKILTAGENVIEFTPTKIGRLAFSCGMGMYTGYFEVVDGNGVVSNQSFVESDAGNTVFSGSCGFGKKNALGNGCCGVTGGKTVVD